MENLGVNKNLITSLKYQVLLMDHAYMRTGEDRIIIEEESSSKIKEIKPFYYYENGLVIFDTDNPVYCYFDNKIIPVLYSKSQEFTDRFNNASFVSVLVVPVNGLGKIERIK